MVSFTWNYFTCNYERNETCMKFQVAIWLEPSSRLFGGCVSSVWIASVSITLYGHHDDNCLCILCIYKGIHQRYCRYLRSINESARNGQIQQRQQHQLFVTCTLLSKFIRTHSDARKFSEMCNVWTEQFRLISIHLFRLINEFSYLYETVFMAVFAGSTIAMCIAMLTHFFLYGIRPLKWFIRFFLSVHKTYKKRKLINE